MKFGELDINNIYLGYNEIPRVYLGENQVWPTGERILTGISIENIIWVNDVSFKGGVANASNCIYEVIGYYNDGGSRDITNKSLITGSLVVPATTATTREMVGTLTLTAQCSGFTSSGNVDVYQEAYVDYTKEYLTFKVTGAGYIRFMTNNSAYTRTISYSKDSGATWTSVVSTVGSETTDEGGTKIPVSAGESVMVKGNNQSYGAGAYYIGFERTTCQYELEGNIMSLIYGDNFENKGLSAGTYNFRSLFSTNTGLTSIENVMLPSALRDYCFAWLFQDCYSLTSIPSNLLPATTLKPYCYDRMFQRCSGLTTAENLILPALNVPNYCYRRMFKECTSLTKAPDLPAPIISANTYSYVQMFSGCTNLNYVKCLAKSGRSTDNFGNWLYGVSETGTFVKNPEAPEWNRGPSGVPDGWTIIDDT